MGSPRLLSVRDPFDTGGGGDELTYVTIPNIVANGTTDNRATIQSVIDQYEALIAAGTITGVTIELPSFGRPILISGPGLTINQDRIHIRGGGEYATRILFAPTGANQKLFSFTKTTNAIIYSCSLRGMSIRSDDTTYKKTAVHVNDGSGFTMREVIIGPMGGWADAANTSIGLLTNGRDHFDIDFCNIAADRPIVVGANANLASIDFDVSSINKTLTIADTNPNIEVEDNVLLTNCTFSNLSMNLGTHGFYYNDTNASGQTFGVTFGPNNRWEQATASGWLCHFVRTNNTSLGLTVTGNVSSGGGNQNGIKLRNVIGGSITSNFFAGAGMTWADADSTVDRIIVGGNFIQDGMLESLSGITKQAMVGGGPSAGTPGAAFEVWTSSTNIYVAERAFNLGVGASSDTMDVPGTLARSTATYNSTTSLTAQTAFSDSILANSLYANGRGVKIEGFGTTAANANAKTITVTFGSDSFVINDVTTAPNSADGEFEFCVWITRANATTQLVRKTATFGGVPQKTRVFQATQNLAANVTLAVKVEPSAAVADEIILYFPVVVSYF